MAATGMTCTANEEISAAWDALKKSTTKLAAIRFGIETTKVGMKTTAEFKLIDTMERDDSKTNEENWNAMLETLKEDEGCFIVFDMRFEHSGRQM
ncbi:hypothetical protein FNF28_00005 [Cafeteria roenbergensis]|nr:hypothetical protein FNF28_00005 [Cafeteria roenbergensis]